MDKAKQILEFEKIINELKACAVSELTKEKISTMDMLLNMKQVEIKMRETTEARGLIDHVGMPPISSMQGLDQVISEVQIGSMLEISQLLEVVSFIKGIRQMRRYLKRGEYLGYELAYYGNGFYEIEEIEAEVERCIRNGIVDSEASTMLRGLRRDIEVKRNMIKVKLEKVILAKKKYLADSYISNRNGHYVIAVKKEYQGQVNGQHIDTSRSGGAIFIEPEAVSRLQEELNLLEIQEDNEVRRILYVLTGLVEAHLEEIKANMEMMLVLDMAFAKGKLSAQMKAREVIFTMDRRIVIRKGRHPLLPEAQCIPLDFEIGEGTTGIVITGPNTGGKTVALKTIGLLSLMAQCGLHVPVDEGSIFAMHNQILCDIGDGQSIEQSLSTFSAHIKSITDILNRVTKESLVLLDELGSGTDPKEGMGIAIAILEMLRIKAGLFIATTHYPEVKDYALRTPNLNNACMQFDKETLMPLYTLVIGEAGESCALYIAEKLGFPSPLIKLARTYIDNEPSEKVAHDEVSNSNSQSMREAILKELNGTKTEQNQSKSEKLVSDYKREAPRKPKFTRGDSVMVFPEKVKGIVFAPDNKEGMVGVQIQKRKKMIKVKRIKLLVPASQLYPPDYDFSIIFDTVSNRKAQHKMRTGYREDMKAEYTSLEEAKWNQLSD